MHPIQDKYGRTFKTLRVSLLNHCNLGCVYCVAGEDSLKEHNSIATHPLLPVSGLLEIIERLHGQLQLETIRLTGGEPLLYQELVTLIGGIRSIGIPQIKLTTNGFLLERLANRLKEAGLESINVSLDAIDEDVFFRMSRRHGAQRIIGGIDAALSAGLSVKINTVVMKSMNESQIIPLLELAISRQISNRYLEIMAMGHLHDQSEKYLITRDEILALIAKSYRYLPLGRAGSATATYWQTEEGHRFGIIANESEPFCRDCNRLRLDSQGNIFGCLSSNHPIALQTADSDMDLQKKLQEALLQKQTLRFTGSDLSMLDIGG
jgi:GTP 3',8-cyclase